MLLQSGVRAWLLAMVLAALCGTRAQAWDYYVSPDGADAAPGTADMPWKTIRYGLTRVAAGDTLHVRKGEYRESPSVEGKRGTQDAPIVIRGEPGALIRATGRDGLLFWKDCAWIVIEGLEITGAKRAGIVIGVNSSNIVIRDCHIHDNVKWQVQTMMSQHITVERCRLHGSTDEHGIYFATTDFPIARDNVIHDNAKAGIHINGDVKEGGDGIITQPIVERNVIYNCGKNGGGAINMDGAESAWVVNNVIHNNLGGGITSYCASAARAGTANRFYFNTIYFQPGKGRYGLQLLKGSRDAVVKNNIIVCGRAALELDEASLPGLESDHNVLLRHGRGAVVMLADKGLSFEDWRAQTKQDAHSFNDIPAFLNAAAGNVRLKAASVGVDQGIAVENAATDAEGAPRPQGAAPDIGAYELRPQKREILE